MRLAIFSDIHGNPLALDAVLSDIQRQDEAGRYWVLGDFAAIGYDPVTPLKKVTALPHASFTRGNTDRYMVTEDLPVPPQQALTNPALLPEIIEATRSVSWTRGYLSAAGWLDWFTNLLLEVRLTLPDGTRVLGVHASPDRDDGPSLQPKHSESELERRLAGCEADVVIVGHSHIPLDRQVGPIRAINLAVSAIQSRRACRPPMSFLMPTSRASVSSCGGWITTAKRSSKPSSTHVIPPLPT